jgi:predicted nucleotidyltransferase
MPRIEPALVPVLRDLARGLQEINVPFGVVGALVPELLLHARPARMTNDADVAVVVASLADFELLKDRLADYGFARTRLPHRMQHRSGGRVDLLPFSESIAPGGRLQLQEGLVLNMAGFRHVVPNAVATTVDDGPTLPLAPLALYVPLKLVAFDDRKAPKDLAGVFHCLEHYLEDDQRRYGAEHEGEGVPYEHTGAYLLGVDGRPFLDAQLAGTVAEVLERFSDADTDVVGLIARERGRMPPTDEERAIIFGHFRWYRLGAGL